VLEPSRGCDYIFHNAALRSSPLFIEDPRKGVDVTVMGFMNVMEAAKRNKVKKVIYASSSSLYNGLPRPYKESAIISPKTSYESPFYCRETELILLVLDILVCMDQMKNTKVDLQIIFRNLFGICTRKKSHNIWGQLGYEPRWKNVEDGIRQFLSLQPSNDSPSSTSLSSSYPSIRI
jgi:hypothetical protein